MKIFLLFALFLIHLEANFLGFTSHKESTKELHKELRTTFVENVKHANAIIKRGEYDKIALYISDRSEMNAKIERLDISNEDKLKLSKELEEYFKLVEQTAYTLKKQAPDLNAHYRHTLDGLGKFNSRIASIGLYELSSKWVELSRIKNSFVKKPNAKLEKEFNDTYDAITVIITELYLDSEIEDPMFDYLGAYKAYFESIALAYKEINYGNIAKLKPLSYKIKAKLELYASSGS